MVNIVSSQFESSSRSSQREHSAQLIESVRHWGALLEQCSGDSAGAALTKLDAMVLSAAAESGYLGFPRSSRLCRVMHAALTETNHARCEAEHRATRVIA